MKAGHQSCADDKSESLKPQIRDLKFEVSDLRTSNAPGVRNSFNPGGAGLDHL
jgi:hypothetical protein